MSDDPDKTEVNTENLDYTQYSSDASATQTGFDKARALAEDASREQGRLIKKRFVLESELGRGGMGAVYVARDLRKVEAEDSRPHVAMKVLAGDFKAHPRAFVTLQQEAVKSQTLAHPNIVTVHDFDRDGDTVFITMELLKGDPLDALLKLEAPFSIETTLRYFQELCAGLEYAHKRNLIHSDFKPANVFVTAGGIVKILDFGIARAANQELAQGQFDAGELGAMTPAYATIEMLERSQPSFSDDIYALACVTYEMLTGKHPYGKANAAQALAEGMKPAKPEVLSKEQWQALYKGLQPEQDKRFATVEDFRLAMLPPRRSPLPLVIAAAAVITGVALWLGYQQYSASAAREAELATRLQAAKDCFYAQEFDCAAENAREVTSLQPDHAEARKILAASEDALTARAAEAAIAVQLEGARECLGAGDLACVERAMASARDAGAGDAALYAIQKEMDEVIANEAAAREAFENRMGQWVDEAAACMAADDFACAQDRASLVLAEDPGNTRAMEIKQGALLAEQVRAQNAVTVGNFLADGEDCFERKNYSCAIARAESALAIVPDHVGARQLRQRASQAQQQAKRSIRIE